jgi:hypothetical protein
MASPLARTLVEADLSIEVTAVGLRATEQGARSAAPTGNTGDAERHANAGAENSSNTGTTEGPEDGGDTESPGYIGHTANSTNTGDAGDHGNTDNVESPGDGGDAEGPGDGGGTKSPRYTGHTKGSSDTGDAGDAEGPGDAGGPGDGGDAAGDTVRDFDAHTTLIEGREAWTVRFDGRGMGLPLRLDVVVPYRTEFAARQEKVRFGHGMSEVIDAGQWRVISGGYARQALREDLRFARDRSDTERHRAVVLGWESARDAAAEVAKFLPDDADEVPETAFWTDMGRSARRDDPEWFTREGITEAISFFQEALDDFVNTHPHPG